MALPLLHEPSPPAHHSTVVDVEHPAWSPWWRWLAVVVAGVAVFVALDAARSAVGGWLVPSPSGPPAANAAAEGRVVEVAVRPGDTLWSLSSEMSPGGDPRPLVDRLARLNGGTRIEAGGSVLVPVELVGDAAASTPGATARR